MPNWCDNSLSLRHSDPEMIKRAEAAVGRGELLNEFVPVPEQLKIVAGSVGDPDQQKKLEADTARNVEELGYGNWYDFCSGVWGTKWDVDAEIINTEDDLIEMTFQSAWAPPTGWYDKMTELGFDVDAYYFEGGMGFCGHYHDGNDNYYEVGATSKETKETVPSDIDDCFGISEYQYEYEQENRDELQVWIEDAVEAKQPSIVHTKMEDA